MNKNQALALWNEYKDYRQTSIYDNPEFHQIQKDADENTVKLCKELTGKKKKNGNDAWKHICLNVENGEAFCKEAIKPYQDKFSALWNKKGQIEKDMENQLSEYAHTCLPEPTQETNIVYSCSGGDYMSQGFGANKYARNKTSENLFLLQMLGYNAEVKAGETHQSGGQYSQAITTYHLYANIDEFGYWCILHSGKFVSVLNWAVDCWRKGVNPLVYFPFLSNDDCEKSQKLAGIWEYEINADNMSLELSWDEINKLSINRVK